MNSKDHDNLCKFLRTVMKSKIEFCVMYLLFIFGLILFFYGLIVFSKEIKYGYLPTYTNENDTIITGYNMTNEGYEYHLNYANKDAYYIVIKKDTIPNK